MRRPETRGERGSALVEFSWLAILLLIPLIWVVLSVFEVQRGAFAVSAAARAAGRAYALADSDATGAARARQAASQALADQGLVTAPLDLSVSCQPYPRACHAGTSVITVRVVTSVDLPWLPASFGLGEPVFSLDSTHTVPIGQFHEAGDAGPR
jgi:Flp pilus assembly protein TadG